MTAEYEEFFKNKASEIMSEQMIIFNTIRQEYRDSGLNSIELWETAKQIRRQITLEGINQHLEKISRRLNDLANLKKQGF